MIVMLYSKVFKKQNSVSIPHGDSLSTPGNIKESTSISSPSILFDMSWAAGGNAPADYNYAYIPQFKRYYYITDWIYDPPYWRADMQVDVLASFSRDILLSVQYVSRSASSWDGAIVDSAYPTTLSVVNNQAASTPPFNPNLKTGCYVVQVINSGGTQSIGATTAYILTQEQFSGIMQLLLANPNWAAIDAQEISINLQKALINPIQYITSCFWFPFPIPQASYTVSSFKLGWWEFPTNQQLSIYDGTNSLVYTFQIDVPSHPQLYRGDYLNDAPYREIKLSFPPFGDIPIRPEWMRATGNKLYIYIRVDFVTGLAVLKIGTVPDSEYFTFYEKTAQMGVPIALAQLSNNIVANQAQEAKSIIGAISDVASLDLGSAIDNVNTAITSSIKTKTPDLQSVGTAGSTVGYHSVPQLHTEFLLLVNEDLQHLGRPLCKSVLLDSLDGYCKCVSPDWTSQNATKMEAERVNNMLTSGVFIDTHVRDLMEA